MGVDEDIGVHQSLAALSNAGHLDDVVDASDSQRPSATDRVRAGSRLERLLISRRPRRSAPLTSLRLASCLRRRSSALQVVSVILMHRNKVANALLSKGR